MPKDNSEEIAFPQIVNLDTEMRKIVLAGAKFLLARLKQKGLIDAKVEYRDIIFTPKLMQNFLEVLRENLDIGKVLFVNECGKRIFDMETPLVCGATLGELERMLVYTCASKIFVTSQKPKKEKVKKKRKKIWSLQQ